MNPDNNTFDFFVSYARSDNANGWITRFVEELLAEHKRFSAGHELKPFFDQHAITTGADWQRQEQEPRSITDPLTTVIEPQEGANHAD